MLSSDLLAFSRNSDLAALMPRVRSPDFWRGLCPQLTISSRPFPDVPPPRRLRAGENAQVVEQVVEEGYFQIEPFFPAKEMRRLAGAVSRVVAAGYHPLFATVFDEPWKLLAALGEALEAILGKNFRVIPDFWLWHVGPEPQNSGWPPHRDFQYPDTLRPDGRPTLLTVWIPFTDATPLNSCIYVLPLSLDRNYPENTSACTIGRLQDVRALPAKAGSVLGWNQYLLHWGSRSCRRARQPRISWGIYFQSGDVPRFDPTARKLRGRLTFEQRLVFIGTAIACYAGRSRLPPALEKFVDWAGEKCGR